MLEIQRNKRVVVEQHRDVWSGGNPEVVDRYVRRKRFAILRGELKGSAEIKAIITSPARRLAAIVCMDVASYSRLMGADEEGTHARIKAIQHGVIEPALAAHRGRLVKTTGDGFLAEFASVVDA